MPNPFEIDQRVRLIAPIYTRRPMSDDGFSRAVDAGTFGTVVDVIDVDHVEVTFGASHQWRINVSALEPIDAGYPPAPSIWTKLSPTPNYLFLRDDALKKAATWGACQTGASYLAAAATWALCHETRRLNDNHQEIARG
jgi:hypothetical protein